MASDNNLDEEVLEAANILLSIKHRSISIKEARKLQELKAKNEDRIKRRRLNIEESDEVPRDFPVAALKCFVKKCSIAMEKQLTKSDTKDDQNRLNLTKKVVEEQFLLLLKDDEDLIKGIPVTIYDIYGNEYAMKFNYWAQKYYVLNGSWKRFVKEHGLRPNEDWVKVWMFRHSQTNKLCFVITCERK